MEVTRPAGPAAGPAEDALAAAAAAAAAAGRVSPGLAGRLRRSFSVRKPLLQQASSLALHRHRSGPGSGDSTTGSHLAGLSSSSSSSSSSSDAVGTSPRRRASWAPIGGTDGAIELLVAGVGEKVSSGGSGILASFGLFGENRAAPGGGRGAGSAQSPPGSSMIFESSLDLTPERIGHIFHTLDTNKDGVVSYDALRRGIEECAGMGPNAIDDVTFATLASFLDTDDSGDISLAEFSEGLRLLTLHVLFSDPDAPALQFECFDYNALQLQRNLIRGDVTAHADFMYGSREDFVSCRWINVGGKGLEASLTLQRLAVKYLLHPLAIEDALFSADHRPKVEVFSSHYFLQIPFFTLVVDGGGADEVNGNSRDTSSGELKTGAFRISYEIISIFVNVPFNNTLITFQRRQIDDCKGCQFTSLRNQIKKSYSKLRQYSAQYLCYAILDMAVDRLPDIADRVARCISEERDRQRTNGYDDTLHKVEAIKENLRNTLRQIKPFLRVLNHVIQDDNIVPGATLYLRDVRDNLECAQDDLRELVNSCDQLDVEFEKFHARQQDKTLYLMTVVTSIFLPAQFLTGVWGMNFTDMPELKQRWGYPLFWVLCIVMTAALLIHFRCGRLGNV